MPKKRSGALRKPHMKTSESSQALLEAQVCELSTTCPDDQPPSVDALFHSGQSTETAVPRYNEVVQPLKFQDVDDRCVCCVCGGDITEPRKEEEALPKTAANKVVCLEERLAAENVCVGQGVKSEPNLKEIVCRSAYFRATLKKLEKVARTDATVLFRGESGTGKGLLARALHALSTRAERSFVKVNCAALPSNLVESELFGHERGAFTGAIARKIGRFELADGGTIFLDEIGELPLELQAKLLRILEDGEFERIGSPLSKHVDVRVVAATNRNLEKAMTTGEFREDLYYRLNVFPIKVPPLRERKQDIPMLVNHFVVKYSPGLGKSIQSISGEVMDAFLAHDWPGNVRELENAVQRALILSEGPVLRLDESFGDSTRKVSQRGGLAALKSLERAAILDALERCNWVVAGKEGAATVLDLPPSTLRDRMKKLGLKKKCWN